MKIKVFGREDFERFKSKEDYIVISITDPKSERVKPLYNNHLIAIMSLRFHDVDKIKVKREECKMCGGTGHIEIFANINNGHCYSCTTDMTIKPFTITNAKQILSFVDKYKDKISLIVVHCEAGISRSAGVASALSLIYKGTDDYYFKHYIPNMLVYRKILNAHMREVK